MSLIDSLSLACTPKQHYVDDTELPRKYCIVLVYASQGGQERTVSFGSLNAIYKVALMFLVRRKLIFQIGIAVMTGINCSPPS